MKKTVVVDSDLNMVEFSGVSKKFGKRELFFEFSLTIDEGEFVCFLGPSGCGKSTLLRMIAGLETPDVGFVRCKQENLGFVFQEPRLLSWRNVGENIALPLELTGFNPAKDQIAKLLEKVRLAPETRKLFPKNLSGGMKMRVSLARALSTMPLVLLMDEPLSALDEATRFDLQEEIYGLFEQQKNLSIVFVTHSVAEAVFLANRIVLLDRNGRLHQIHKVGLPKRRDQKLRSSIDYFSEVNIVTKLYHKMLEQFKLAETR